MAKDDASTRFPFISLEKALSKAQQLFEGDRTGKPMPVVTAFELWGYSAKSSGGFQTTGALKYYGLLEDEGSNADRKLKLTNAARRYFLDERDETRAAMLADFALNPPLFRWLWTKDGWSEGIPADTVARSHLKIERNLNDQSARSLLAIFKENVQFAGLKPSANQDTPLESPPQTEPTPKAQVETERSPMTSTASPMETLYSQVLATSGAPEGAAIDARIVGGRVIINANVDLKGLRKLKRQIAMFEQMLSMDDEDDDVETSEAAAKRFVG
ncbi:MAG: hypothetical protein EOQ55_28560 [Mesorhizobium sp.]|uniref:hypothetical protein n=1 Tax=Mesorhizobium sp. TaxID=1871066 RepID=UPI000FE72DCC|nr:hypothetical protein [Mesorhizobium sp.]RWG11400.1 MAG: hypothetical protein EOQ55_28560 [Mesorhizobium sp.]RWI95055.1 MAG: hypothetical protein EOR21_10110 [Mesorhizobium sp.]